MFKRLIRIYKVNNGFHIGIPAKVKSIMNLDKEDYLELELVDENTFIVKKIKKI